ncbi:unnamed protein product [Dibothriocephalus latus]|uniref:EF-hand domain-containing protein n=1 Tax=Dibothriocephalus latus TaxID=60516 RepID=A0A3P7P3L7_DIBLA|nr:unnamed protein product [Dibothriocephalus latus]
MPTDKQIEELMEGLDVDKSGKVSSKELLAAFQGSGIDMDSVKDFIAAHDLDQDGQLDKAEMTDFFKSLGC